MELKGELPLLLLLLASSTAISSSSNSNTSTCPFNFTVLDDYLLWEQNHKESSSKESCRFAISAIHLLQSDLLLRTSLFLAPLPSAPSCWSHLSSLLGFDPRPTCGFPESFLSVGCANISTREQFESLVPAESLDELRSPCNRSLLSGSKCASCTTSLTSFKASSRLSPDPPNNLSTCSNYLSIYTAAVINPFGPSDPGTADCLFFLSLSPHSSASSLTWIYILVAALSASVVLLISLFVWRRSRKRRKRKKKGHTAAEAITALIPVEMVSHTGPARYTLEEMREATGNFARENIIGRGGYGNVYRGVLPDGSEVAVKRFKNCAAAGDPSFAHEVEVIASVRHVNLVSLRGYCIASTGLEGHQRMIVCELVRNGSLHDHLFGSSDRRRRTMSWPVRRRVALGTARGLAYLHQGAQPKIIHRDVKASNVLLDERFEPKLADFGLARFAPNDGLSHLSTRVAGTLGYVAPEYALYGKLSEKSDVYSFGVLLLELLSGRRAVMVASSDGEQQPWLLIDWAWSLVKEDRALDVVEAGMEEVGPAEAIDKFVLVAVLCSHPHLHARPTMDQVINMLDTEAAVPPIPDRPVSLLADVDRSGQLTTTSSDHSTAEN